MTKNDILETISNLYDYEFKNGGDGTILCYYANDPDKLLYQFQSKNQAMMHWLPNFEDDDHGNFTKEIDFIKSCMVRDYLDIIPGDYSFRKIRNNAYLVMDNIFNSASFVLEITDGKILCNDQDCLENMKSAYDNAGEILLAISNFENDWYTDAQKSAPSRQGMTDGQDDKKHTYLITMAAVESADMEIELTDKEYEIVERVFHEMDSKCHGLCGSVYIESRERDDMDEMDLEDREV